LERGAVVEKMLQREIEAAARKLRNHLEPRGETSLLALHEAWTEDERSFYMGLGALILQRHVGLQERQGTIWVVRGSEWTAIGWRQLSAGSRIAPALCPLCREGFGPGGELSICITCPSLLDACPSGGSARLLLAA
jgi:hypothetical protein